MRRNRQKSDFTDLIRILVVLIAILLPFQTIVNVWVTMLLCLVILFKAFSGRLHRENLSLNLPILLVVLFAWYLVGLIYTRDFAEGLVQLRIKLPLLVFPLLFFTGEFRSIRYSEVFQAFIFGCVLVFLVCLIIAFSRSFSLADGKPVFDPITYASGENLFLDSLRRNSNYFFGKYLSYFMHPTYFAMYLSLAIFCLLDLKQEKGRFWITERPWLYYLLLSLLLLAILMLISKAGILVLFVLLAGSVLLNRRHQFRRITKILSLVLLFLTLGLIIRFNPRFQNSLRVLREYAQDKSLAESKDSGESTAVRLIVWPEAVRLICQHPLFGIGTGDVRSTLVEAYRDSNLTAAAEHRYNSHNQYLETSLALGIPGGCLIIFLLVFPFLSRGGKLGYPAVSLILLTGLNFIFESMLNRQAGVMFFAFFYTYFLSYPDDATRLGYWNTGKFIFDKLLSLIGLIVTFPFWVIIAILIKASSKGPVFYTQTRIGRNGNEFRMSKFRTMYPNTGSTITVSSDPRITGIGKFLRRWKLDELPELWCILKGDMSFVGPRPDVPGFADKLEGEDRKILRLRPGLTGPATVKYANEEYLLAGVEDPEKYNREVIWPDKVRINLDYYYRHNLWLDLKYIVLTFKPKRNR